MDSLRHSNDGYWLASIRLQGQRRLQGYQYLKNLILKNNLPLLKQVQQQAGGLF